MMSVTPSQPNQFTKPVQTSSAMRSMYEVNLYKAGLVHVLADDVEDAAWQAINMCFEQDDILLDVCPLDETE